MASTYSVQEALEVVKRTAGLGPADSWGVLAADMAVKEMWRRGAWRQSLADLPAIGLVPGLQDLGEPLVDIPSDIAGLWRADYVYLMEDGNVSITPMSVHRSLEGNNIPCHPNAISYQQDNNSYRFPGIIPSNLASPWHFVRGTYKKKPPSITNLNIGGTYLPWDDDLFPVFVQVLRWQAMALVGADRALDQRQIAVAGINEAAAQEAEYLGQSQQMSSIDVGGW